MIEIILWILLTLSIATVSAVIAKKHGPEFIIGMFASMLVIANILANKIVMFFGFAIDAGTIIYPATFLLTDILSEFFGKKAAKKAVWTGFMANLMLIASVWIAILWEPASFYEHQDAFKTVLGNTGRIILASLIAYTFSQNFDIWFFHKIKKKTGKKLLWLRNNGSTMVSQLFDTIIFTVIAFLGVFPVVPMIVGMYIVKIIIALLDTPFIYAIKWYYDMGKIKSKRKN